METVGDRRERQSVIGKILERKKMMKILSNLILSLGYQNEQLIQGNQK